MKKTFFSLLCMAIVAHSFCQAKAPNLSKEDYLKKSKNQKTTGIILLVGGLTVAGTGLVIVLSDLSHLFEPGSENVDHGSLPDVLGYGGLAMMAASIPFLIAGGKNKKKAMSAALIIEKMPAIRYGSNMLYQSYPAIGLYLQLGISK
jgi:hypothetical protein